MCQIIPKEANGVKRPAQVTEPLQVIPEDEELEVKHVKMTVHVQATEHPSYATRAARMSSAPIAHVHHPSESFNPYCASSPLSTLKAIRNEFQFDHLLSTQFGKRLED